MKITITKKTAKLFVSHDPMRPAMGGVCYDAERSALVMTNGAILAVVPVEDGLGKSCIIPVDALPEKAGATSDVSLTNGKLTVERRDKNGSDLGTRTCTPIEAQFPAWHQLFTNRKVVLACHTGSRSVICARMLAAFSSLAKNLGATDPYARLTFYGSTCACRVDLAPSGEGTAAYGLIMPVRA